MFLKNLPDEQYLHFQMTLNDADLEFWFEDLDGYITVTPLDEESKTEGEFLCFDGIYYALVHAVDKNGEGYVIGKTLRTEFRVNFSKVIELSEKDIPVKSADDGYYKDLFLGGLHFVP